MDPLVSVDWLSSRLGREGVVVLDATLPPVGAVPPPDVQARYLAQHIPGAVFFDIEALSDHSTGLPHMLPTAESFGQSMGMLGIRERDTVVVYEQRGVFSAPRAWWMLRVMGAHAVYVLDGGLDAWMAAGHDVESGTVVRAPASFEAMLDSGAVCSLAHVQQALAGGEQGVQVVDARSAGRFRGTDPEPRPQLSSGHMPGAVNVPYSELVQDGRLKDVEGLRAVFTGRGVNLGRPVITSCGSGVTAAVLTLALQRLGAPQAALFDGSWAEYAQQPGVAILRQCTPTVKQQRTRDRRWLSARGRRRV